MVANNSDNKPILSTKVRTGSEFTMVKFQPTSSDNMTNKNDWPVKGLMGGYYNNIRYGLPGDSGGCQPTARTSRNVAMFINHVGSMTIIQVTHASYFQEWCRKGEISPVIIFGALPSLLMDASLINQNLQIPI